MVRVLISRDSDESENSDTEAHRGHRAGVAKAWRGCRIGDSDARRWRGAGGAEDPQGRGAGGAEAPQGRGAGGAGSLRGCKTSGAAGRWEAAWIDGGGQGRVEDGMEAGGERLC
jgi:hypothetical protein